MTPRQTENLLNRLREERRGGAPREHWVSKNRDLLLAQVRNTVDAKKTPTLAHTVRHLFGILFPLRSVMVTARAFGVFVLVTASVLTGGLATAQMYGDSIPGDGLYKVKVGVEKLQLALAPNDEYRANLHTEFADRRIDEIARLAESGDEGDAYLKDTLNAFEGEVLALETNLDALSTSAPDHVAELAKTMERKMAVYQNLLRKAQVNVSGDLRHSIVATRDRVDEASISAMAMLVEKHLQGDEHASQATVVNKFEERIRLAESTLPPDEGSDDSAAPTKSARAKTAIAEAKTLIEEEKYRAALVKITEIAQLTKDDDESADETGDDATVTEGDDGSTQEPTAPEGDAADGTGNAPDDGSTVTTEGDSGSGSTADVTEPAPDSSQEGQGG